MNNTFNVIVNTIEGKTVTFQMSAIILPTSDGNRTVLANHMEVVVEVVPGILQMISNQKKQRYFVSEGIFHFKQNQATLLCDAFESEAEIDVERAKKSLEKAQLELQQYQDKQTLSKAEQRLKRAISRLKLKGE